MNCGRTTRKGTPCQAGRRTEFVGRDSFELSACGHHLTPAERTDLEARRAAYRARLNAMVPACWAWPAPASLPGAEDSQARADAMLEWQKGRCAACGKTGQDLIEDHDHYTGLVRGWLCHGCNVAEGMSHISGMPIWWKYRERSPAVVWQLKLDYIPTWGENAITDPEAICALKDGLLTLEQVRNGERISQHDRLWRKPINLGL